MAFRSAEDGEWGIGLCGLGGLLLPLVGLLLLLLLLPNPTPPLALPRFELLPPLGS